MSIRAIVGLSILLAAAGLGAWTTQVAANDQLARGLTAASVFLACLGVAVLLLPTPYQERIRRGDDLWDMTPLQMITVRWWIVVFLCAAAGVGAVELPRRLDAARTGDSLRATQRTEK